MKTYIIQIRRRERDLPRDRARAIRLAKALFFEQLQGVWDRLKAAGVALEPVQDQEGSFSAAGGMTFNCAPIVGAIIATIPEDIAEHFRRDPDVSYVSVNQAVRLIAPISKHSDGR